MAAPSRRTTIALTAVTMVPLAANSLLCRMALGERAIDSASFTSVRLTSGALMLWLILRLRRTPRHTEVRDDWTAAAMLFLYAICFSFAYLTLSAGSGALILFGAVKLTMFFAGLRAGEHFPPLAWAGLMLALAGLVYLVSPGITAPDPGGAGLMTVAGIAWGVYSLRGRGVADPLGATAHNFLLSVPMGLLVSLATLGGLHASAWGIGLAVASGAVASGLGYALWYTALRGLSATSAATVQLSVPVLAAFGGVLILDESVTPRLLAASAAVLGGIGLVLARRRPAGA